jgi:hypothetical protein
VSSLSGKDEKKSRGLVKKQKRMYGERMDPSEWRDWWMRQGSDELLELLLLWWDPLDVRGTSEEEGAYDRYLGPIASMLEHGCSVEELAEFLSTVRAERMGLHKDAVLDHLTAAKIHAWHQAVQQASER